MDEAGTNSKGRGGSIKGLLRLLKEVRSGELRTLTIYDIMSRSSRESGW
jgi:hypothetical protein